MAQIASSLGISVQTVSAVVNNKPGISPETRRRVHDAIERLDYQVNEHARTLRGVRTKIVGVIVPSITNPYFPEFVKGIEDAARQIGYSIFLCNTDYKLEHLLGYFSLIKTNKASGLICSVGIAGEWLSHPDVMRWLRKFAKDDVTVVLNGRLTEDVPVKSVLTDTDAAIREAAKHLLAHGHRRIALITPEPGLAISDERLGSFKVAFAALGQPLDKRLIVPGTFHIETGAKAARRLMAVRQRPTAIIAANDLSAFGVISELNAMGIRVPDEVSVLGFDDVAFAKVFQPPLSTIQQPLYDLGREALQLATSGYRREAGAPEVVTLAARFIARKSTGAVC